MLRGGIGAHTPDSPSRASLRGEPCPKFCQERIEFLDSADDVLRLMRGVGFGDLEILPDPAGIPRVVLGALYQEI